MLRNRPDHRSRLYAAKLKRRWLVCTERLGRARKLKADCEAFDLFEARAMGSVVLAEYLNRRGRLFAAIQTALGRGRRALNLYHLEGRGRIRQGSLSG